MTQLVLKVLKIVGLVLFGAIIALIARTSKENQPPRPETFSINDTRGDTFVLLRDTPFDQEWGTNGDHGYIYVKICHAGQKKTCDWIWTNEDH